MTDLIHRITLTSLRTFSVFADTGSVSLAADTLHVTPGAVSQQLKQLESQLEVQLLIRNGKRLELTRAGHILAKGVTPGFAQLNRAINEVHKAGAKQSLRLKLMPSLAICWLLPQLASFYTDNPDVALDIATVPGRDDTTLDNADLAVRLGKGDWPGVDAQLLFADALLPVCSPALAKTIKKPLDLLKQPLLHSAMRPEAWKIWLNAQGIELADTANSTRFSNAALAYQAAKVGIGVAIAQYPYVKRELASGELVAPFPQPVTTEMGYYLVSHKTRHENPNVRKFRQWLLSLDA